MLGDEMGGSGVIDRATYREAMSRLGAAVNVITTTGIDGDRGFTASAVCSVTDSPPTLLLCVNQSSDNHDPLKANGILCVNTLSATQQEFSPLFAGFTGVPQAERFRPEQWTRLATGCPVLRDALVAFDCRIAQMFEVGTHTVMFCEVQAIAFGSVPEGLIYFNRAYHSLRVIA